MTKEKKQTTAQEYLQLKQKHKDQIIFYRIGEFYELFFDDAIQVAQQLNLSLTSRGKHHGNEVPMCGIPVGSKDLYISRLLKQNKKIALYEQKHDDEHDLYIRYLKQIYTPGTLTDEMLLTQAQNNFLAAIYVQNNKVGFSTVDLSTGELVVQHILLEQLESTLSHWQPAEILIDENEDINIMKLKWHFKISRVRMHDNLNLFESILQNMYEHDVRSVLHDMNLLDMLQRLSVQSLLEYIQLTQCMQHVYLKKPKCLIDRTFLYIHQTAKDSLELIYSTSGKKESGLLNLINQTLTPMGSRRMIQLINAPYVNKALIEKRLHFLELFMNQYDKVLQLRKSLSNVYDVERILVRIYNAQEKKIDYVNLLISMKKLSQVHEMLPKEFRNEYEDVIKQLDIIAQFLEQNISTDVNNILNLNTHADYNNMQYEFMAITKSIEMLESQVQSEVGSSATIRMIQGLDYVIDIPSRNKHAVPYHFQCIQTLSGSKRYTTEALQELNYRYKQIQMSLNEIENNILKRVANDLQQYKIALQHICEFISDLDIYLSFAHVSYEYKYIKPILNNEKTLHIVQGKHPVLYSKNQFFVANNCRLTQDELTMLLTGPNMSGKSTYMKQLAHMIILTQMGCFIPAENACIGIVDAIYTRLGSNDDITDDKSTFMCEMSEMSYILQHATEKSFLIIDEIGRGTTPVEGEAIARAILKYLHTQLCARTIFATHFHNLGNLNDELIDKHILLKHMSTHNIDLLHIEYMYKLIDGLSNCSYGLAVANQARIPEGVIKMAMQYLKQIAT